MSLNEKERRTRDRAESHGAHYAGVIIQEAKRAGISVPLGFALVEQESGFRNIWGHDPPPNGGTSWGPAPKRVTKDDYLAYKRRRGSRGQGGMQGVGPVQLTYWSFQDMADREGGCWIARFNIRVGFHLLARLVKQHGERLGLAIYNGGAGNPNHEYAEQVLDRRRKWHQRLT